MSFVIREIDASGGVLVSFDVDGLDQHISGLPVHDREKLVEALNAYETAYVRGLKQEEPPPVHDDVRALIGRPAE